MKEILKSPYLFLPWLSTVLHKHGISSTKVIFVVSAQLLITKEAMNYSTSQPQLYIIVVGNEATK